MSADDSQLFCESSVFCVRTVGISSNLIIVSIHYPKIKYNSLNAIMKKVLL